MIRTWLMMLMVLPLMACEEISVADVFEKYLWQNRVVVVFSPSTDDAKLKAFEADYRRYVQALTERDVVVWVIVDREKVKVDGRIKPNIPTPAFYEYFKTKPSDFVMILIGKDGEIKDQQTNRVPLKTWIKTIDAMPMQRD